MEIDTQGSIRFRRVIDVLERLVSDHGAPRYLRSDNGLEFISRAVLTWLQQADTETAHIEPGKPWQDGTAKSLNDKFRDECLSMEWFRNRTEARHYRDEATPLQRGPAAFEPRLQNTEAVQRTAARATSVNHRAVPNSR